MDDAITDAMISRVRKVAEGGTINGTYGAFPIAALEAFKADLSVMCDTLARQPPSQVPAEDVERLIRELRTGTGLSERKGDSGGVIRDAWVHDAMQRAADALAALTALQVTEGDKVEPDDLVRQWQEESHEWFKRDIAEIVESFAKWMIRSQSNKVSKPL
jgi:hypothetical protein